MKKIAICSHAIGTASETFIRRHMNELAPDQSVVIAETDTPQHGGAWTVAGPTLLVKKLDQGIGIRAFNYFVGRLGIKTRNPKDKAIKLFLQKHGVQVIMAEYLDYSLRYIAVAKRLRIPLFAHAHGYDVSLRLRDPLWRQKYLQLNEISGVITMSEYSKQKLERIGIKPEKIHIVPYGIILPAPSVREIKNPSVAVLRLLAVGRMVAKKAPVLLLDSFRRAAEVHSNLHLDYVGDGPLFTAAKHYVQAFKLEEKVTLHGVVENAGVLKLMLEADIFVQHSSTCPETGDEEGMPVAILEAMASGLPVISTFHAGIPEAVMDGQTGLLVNEGDTTAMANAILKLADNPGLMANMGMAGRARVETNFTWERERDSLLQLLKIHENET